MVINDQEEVVDLFPIINRIVVWLNNVLYWRRKALSLVLRPKLEEMQGRYNASNECQTDGMVSEVRYLEIRK